jgi:hypothetical protein
VVKANSREQFLTKLVMAAQAPLGLMEIFMLAVAEEFAIQQGAQS